MNVRTLAISVVGALSLFGGLAATAGPAAASVRPAISNDVLVNYDGGTVHLGAKLKLGVWYQSFSGGSSHYWVGVYNPHGVRVFAAEGYASAAYWEYGYVKTTELGTYHTLYEVQGGHFWVTTKVVR